MEPREQRLVIILADISGYTRFMVENQLSAVHGQICINTLIESILREVDIPLQLQEIEGDAVFLYAAHPGTEEGWQDVLAQVRLKLVRFFDSFLEGMVTAQEATPCGCAVCSNANGLSLKVVVHSGSAVFHSIGGRPQVSGADVILAHRLLKNSVPSHEYLLMSDAAYQELGREMGLDFEPGRERYEGFGDVETQVHTLTDISDRIRDELYALDPNTLATRARQYVRWAAVSQFSAWRVQLRRPTSQTSWPRRIGFGFGMTALFPGLVLLMLFRIPRKLLAQRSVYVPGRHALGSHVPGTHGSDEPVRGVLG